MARMLVIENPYTGLKILEKLTKDKNQRVSEFAKYKLHKRRNLVTR